jgi:anaerobic ribonucleoside-triphosphate reductase
MRCKACSVDLNENAARCPLCGSPSQDVPPRIAGVAFQDYPAYQRRAHHREKQKRHASAGRSMPFGDALRARFHL